MQAARSSEGRLALIRLLSITVSRTAVFVVAAATLKSPSVYKVFAPPTTTPSPPPQPPLRTQSQVAYLTSFNHQYVYCNIYQDLISWIFGRARFPVSRRGAGVADVLLKWMLASEPSVEQCYVKCTTGEGRYGTAFEGTRVRRCQACLEKITTPQITWHVRPQPPQEGVRPGVSQRGWAGDLCPISVFFLSWKEFQEIVFSILELQGLINDV